MPKEQPQSYAVTHPLVGASWNVWRRLRRAHRVDPGYWPKAALINVCTAAAAPLRALDSRRTRAGAAPLAKPPIFIIGHWRSGTTHLHNLFCEDPQFGYVSTFQTVIPGGCISGRFLAPLMEARMPSIRPMDNMELSLFGPQEEEVALAHMTPCAYYHALYFPRAMRFFFDRYVLFDGIAREEKDEWADTYRALLEKAAFMAGGRRLVLKNPANTARIRELVAMFPGAKFVHIYRDPFVVLPSTVHFYDRIHPITVLQRVDREAIVGNVYAMYGALMTRCLETQGAVPEGQWAEVRFEDLERDPVGEMDRLYRTLDLGPFDAREKVSAYVAAQSDYRKNEFTLGPSTRDRITEVSGPFVTRWGYAPPN